MDKIKIVFILTTLDIGGTETQFIEMLRRINRERFELRVLAFPYDGKLREKIEDLDIPLTGLGFSGLAGKFRTRSYLQLYRLIRDLVGYFRREKPLIVQSYLFWGNIYGSIAAKLARIPIIITGRRGLCENNVQKPHYHWLQALSNLCATTIIANSLAVKQSCLHNEKYVTDEKVQVVHNGVDVDKYSVIGEIVEKKNALHIPEHAKVVGIIANLRDCKGHRDFLKAAARVLSKCPNTVFLIIGRDEGMKHELESLARELGIAEAVIFTGERDDIPEILAMLDILVSASLSEGFSNTLLEGMASKKAVIATNVGGTPELVEHEKTGFLVSVGDCDGLAKAILRVLEDRTLQEQLGCAARQKVATQFRMERMITQIENVYDDLLREHVWIKSR